MSLIEAGVRSTNARLVIISLTYRPAPNSRHSRRNAVLVMPAIGASTTGTSSSGGPMLSCFATLSGTADRTPWVLMAVASRVVTGQFSQKERAAMSPLTGRARVEADAAARGLEIDIVDRVGATSLEHAAELLGIDPSGIVKTLVVKHKDGSYLFALIPGDRQISWPKLRALVGVNKLSLPDETKALEATGYPRGTITPLGSTTAWPVYADASMV